MEALRERVEGRDEAVLCCRRPCIGLCGEPEVRIRRQRAVPLGLDRAEEAVSVVSVGLDRVL